MKMRALCLSCGILLAILVLIVQPLAQSRLPKEYISPDEIITLSADMTFEQAFAVLSKVAFEKEGKIIIDPMKRQGRIEIQITNLPWKKALEIILIAHNLKYIEHEKFYEIAGDQEEVNLEKQTISLNSREIRIEAVFFEGDRRKLAEAGIDWTFLRSGSQFTGGVSMSGANVVTENMFQAQGSYSKSSGGIDYSITGMLKTFENENMGRILAQPQVVVLSGKEGRIQVGQDFSIKTLDFAGNVIDNFFSTGTILKVKPIVIQESDVNFIYLNIHAERSSAIPDAVSTTINKSQADTDVLLLDGESTVLGGLYSRDHKTVRKGIPFLKDLPWWALGLRYVFGFNQLDVQDKELLVVIRASLVPELKVRNAAPIPSMNDIYQQGENNNRQKFNENWEHRNEKKVGE